MPVSLPVDSLREMWWRGVKEPKLRAMMATVRNFARAALTTLGLVAFVFPWSPFRPFRLWSVQAIETCMLDEEDEEDAVYNTERTHWGIMRGSQSRPSSLIPSCGYGQSSSRETASIIEHKEKGDVYTVQKLRCSLSKTFPPSWKRQLLRLRQGQWATERELQNCPEEERRFPQHWEDPRIVSHKKPACWRGEERRRKGGRDVKTGQHKSTALLTLLSSLLRSSSFLILSLTHTFIHFLQLIIIWTSVLFFLSLFTLFSL